MSANYGGSYVAAVLPVISSVASIRLAHGSWISRLVIELDGGQHDEQRGYDSRRTRWLEAEGWLVLRFWNNELARNEDGVLIRILEVLQMLLPSPRPSPERERGKTALAAPLPGQKTRSG